MYIKASFKKKENFSHWGNCGNVIAEGNWIIITMMGGYHKLMEDKIGWDVTGSVLGIGEDMWEALFCHILLLTEPANRLDSSGSTSDGGDDKAGGTSNCDNNTAESGGGGLRPSSLLRPPSQESGSFRHSYLREEEDEFEKLFSELTFAPTASKVAELKRRATRLLEEATWKSGVPSVIVEGVCTDSSSTNTVDDSVESNSESSPSGSAMALSPSCEACGKVKVKDKDHDSGTDSLTSSDSLLRRKPSFTQPNDKLFVDLLDDLDRISGNTNSARRRRRARDLFSDWLFSSDSKNPANFRAEGCSPDGFSDYARRRVSEANLADLRRNSDPFDRWRPRSMQYDYMYMSEVSKH